MAITASGTVAVSTPFASAASGTVTRAEAAGNTIVVVVAIPKNNAVVNAGGVTDSGGSVYSRQVQQINGVLATLEIWSTAAGASLASTSVSVAISVASKFDVTVFEYLGVQALGITNQANGAVANPSIALTTQDANNWVVGGFCGQGIGASTQLAPAILRGSSQTSGGAATTNCGGALTDNNAATPSSVTNTITNADTAWALGALELRSVLPAASPLLPSTILALLGIGH